MSGLSVAALKVNLKYIININEEQMVSCELLSHLSDCAEVQLRWRGALPSAASTSGSAP